MPADVEYRASLDDSEVLKALKNIDRNMDKLANSGEKSFGDISKSAKKTGVQIGFVSGVVQELTRRFISMGQQAARAILGIAKEGVALNKRLEVLEIRISNILGNNQKAAQAFLATIQETATQLKLDYVELAELATTILPDAESMAAAAEVSARAMQLGAARAIPEANVRRAITEAMNGQFISMQKILNVSTQQIARIKELEKDIGRTAAISQVLGEELQDAGFNVEDMATSFTALFKIIESEGQNLKIVFAGPIFEELKEQASEFLEVFDEHRDDIEKVAIAFGQMAANIVDMVGSNLTEFIDSLDYEQLEDMVDAFDEMVDAVSFFMDTLSSGETQNQIILFFRDLEEMANSITTALEGAARIGLQLRAELARRQAEAQAMGGDQRSLLGGPTWVVAGRPGADAAAAGQEAYNKVIEEGEEAVRKYNEALEENTRRSEERGDAVDEATDEDAAAGDAFRRNKQLLEELTAAEKEAAEAQDKIDERREKLSTEAGRRLIEIEKDTQREILDDAIDAAQKREDLARENADKIEDIHRKHQQEIADAARDLSRDEEDIYRKYARDRAETERDSANERLDIEREYRRELQRIRDRFNESAAEAERRNDAQAFLEAVRQKDREIDEAKRGRSERLEDASIRAAEQRENLKQQLEYEIEDARIANARKLEDLQIRLERELEAQRLAYERDLEEQRITEERKAEERMRAYTREIIDHHNKEKQKRDDLQESLKAEFEMVKKAADLKREYEVESARQTAREVNAARSSIDYSRSSYSTSSGAPAFMQEGGPVEPGRPYIVGERGPELFVPQQAGQVVPTPALAAVQAISNDNSRRVDVGGINVGEDMFSNPVMLRKMENIILGVLAEAI